LACAGLAQLFDQMGTNEDRGFERCGRGRT